MARAQQDGSSPEPVEGLPREGPRTFPLGRLMPPAVSCSLCEAGLSPSGDSMCPAPGPALAPPFPPAPRLLLHSPAPSVWGPPLGTGGQEPSPQQPGPERLPALLGGEVCRGRGGGRPGGRASGGVPDVWWPPGGVRPRTRGPRRAARPGDWRSAPEDGR
ncbi:bcl-2-binding component 3 isoform X2 [Sminthopsis crassicaudata]|uniref:bcl-2-binding component 3 isoform X2 n=1 Tax=Sminthopsis crassicaudata TaxID=9301 RepID=UPI003D68C2E9